jgi:hypothetical protein
MARTFNGTTEYIQSGRSPVNNYNTSNFIPACFSAWVYPTSATGDVCIMGETSTLANAGGRLMSSRSGNGQLTWYPLASTSGSFGASGTLTLNAWQHVGLRCNNAGSWAQGFLNGVFLGNLGGGTFLNLPFGNSTAAFHVGADKDGSSSYFFSGRIADAAMWTNIVLSTQEYVALAHGVRPGQLHPESLVIWWPLDWGSVPALDLSWNKINGTLHGTSLITGPPLINAAPIFPGIAIPQSFVGPPPPVFNLMPQIVT